MGARVAHYLERCFSIKPMLWVCQKKFNLEGNQIYSPFNLFTLCIGCNGTTGQYLFSHRQLTVLPQFIGRIYFLDIISLNIGDFWHICGQKMYRSPEDRDVNSPILLVYRSLMKNTRRRNLPIQSYDSSSISWSWSGTLLSSLSLDGFSWYACTTYFPRMPLVAQSCPPAAAPTTS
jgi:hypothetical protein